jgi:SAM-dependent methyltransferase
MAVDHFGRDVAANYDENEAAMFEPAVVEPAVEFLADLAAGSPALELAIGTGRIALPLHQRGIEVHGIDLSPAMVEQLRGKPGGDQIPVTIGDIATAPFPGRFGLAFLVFNTIGNLTSQAEQVACFRNVAHHLVPGGHFVIELLMPNLPAVQSGQTTQLFDLSPSHVGVDEYDAATQSLVSHHFYRDRESWRYEATPMRYVWPAELDLMAELAGMTLVERWADWDRSPFTMTSPKHISVWRKPPA